MSIIKIMPSTHGRENGFTLLEALVTLVILAVGLLGVAALQLKGLQSAHSAYQSTVASVIATDATERLWIRRGQLGAGESLSSADVDEVEDDWITYWTTEFDPDAMDARPLSIPLITGAGATEITASGSTYTITVAWTETRFGERDEDDQPIDRITLTYTIELP